MLEIVICS